MLSELQQEQLLASLYATAEILDQQLQPRAAALMVADLKIYDEQPLAEALTALRRTGQRLTPENVIRHLVTQDGRPEANEAWAIAMTSYDEAETVLMTPEIQQAAAEAERVFRAGDKIGARMAFIATYERLVTTARQVGTPLAWSLSLGHDAERRASAIESAERLGRLPAPQAQALLAQHTVGQTTAEGRAIAGLLTGPVGAPSPELRERLQALKAGLEQQKRERIAARRAQLAHYGENLKARRVQLMAQARGAKRD